eukprot:7487541-Ditylum_brightwellii.AAC.2
MKRSKTAKEDLDLVKTVCDDLNHKIATLVQAQPQPIVTTKKIMRKKGHQKEEYVHGCSQ